MIENLESRQFMSVTLPAADGILIDAAQPTTTVVVDASAKVKVQDLHFTASANKASATLMR
jgi:hypothetical protein